MYSRCAHVHASRGAGQAGSATHVVRVPDSLLRIAARSCPTHPLHGSECHMVSAAGLAVVQNRAADQGVQRVLSTVSEVAIDAAVFISSACLHSDGRRTGRDSLTYGSRNIDSLPSKAPRQSTRHPNVPIVPNKHLPTLSDTHLTKYTSIPAIAWSSFTLASAAWRCRSESGREPSSSGRPGKTGRAETVGTSADVRRVK